MNPAKTLTQEVVRAYYDRRADDLIRYLNRMETIMEKSVVLSIARVAHEVNAAYCRSLGDFTQTAWEDAPNWQRTSACAGVKMHLDNPNATAEDSHKAWMEQKLQEGWVYGPEKDPNKKTHHCLVPYEQLPLEQRSKDFIFRGIVHAIAREMSRPS